MSKYQTEQRKILIHFFENSKHGTFSAQDINDALAEHGIRMSAIYRNLSEKEKERMQCKVSEKNRPGSLYQYIDPLHCVGIIHLKCQSCETTLHLGRHVSNLVFGMAKDDFSFTMNASAAVLYGQCQQCSTLPAG